MEEREKKYYPMNAELMRKLKLSLDLGKVYDHQVQSKIDEIYEIDELADVKLKNKDFRTLDHYKKLSKEGYFKRIINENDIKKSEIENKNFQNKINLENKQQELQQQKFDLEHMRNSIISDFEYYQKRIDNLKNNTNENFANKMNDLINEIQHYIDNIPIKNDQILINYIIYFNKKNFTN